MRVLLFTGAGSSVELGIPAMRSMVEDLDRHLQSQEFTDDVYGHFRRLIEDTNSDLEDLIATIENLERGELSRKTIGMKTDSSLLATVRAMRWETEWFVQQSCEGIRERSACALWGAMLRRTQTHRLCIATTNYDRSLEVACQRSGVRLDDGFTPFEGKEYAEWRGFDEDSAIKLLKIHGSTDWYHGVENDVYKLKHSLPIFGDLSVSVQSGDVPSLSSAMILPTREKIINRPPYPDLVTEFRTSARGADVAVFVGTSLRDPDIHDVFVQCANRIPTYLIDVSISNTSLLELDNVIFVQQSASQFLVSTFPRMLDHMRNGVEPKMEIQHSARVSSILKGIETLESNDGRTEDICKTIEELADHEISVDIDVIRPLINHDDTIVRRYVLSLIPYSLDWRPAVDLAKENVSRGDDPAFSEEFSLLGKMGLIEKLEKCV